MRRFVLGWKKLGWEEKLQAHLVVYADDFVMLCRSNTQEAMKRMQAIMKTLKLTVNEQKTRICRVPEESFDFLGYTIGRCYSPKDGRAFIGTRPSRKRIGAICQSISQMTQPAFQWKAVEALVEDLHRTLRGWGNYFCLGAVSRAYRAVDNHARHRLRQWLNGKHRSRGVHSVRHAPPDAAPGLGPAKTSTHDRQPLVCERMNPLERKPDAPAGHVRFDERGVETECMTGYSGTGNRKGRTPLRPGLNTTAPLLDSTKSVGRVLLLLVLVLVLGSS